MLKAQRHGIPSFVVKLSRHAICCSAASLGDTICLADNHDMLIRKDNENCPACLGPGLRDLHAEREGLGKPLLQLVEVGPKPS